MSKNPRVSIIIPTYNRAHLISRAIQSVLNQTYQDFEIIVVDDASTDNIEEVLKGINDRRIQYTRHEENKGAAAARNTGIEIARGDYIAFQDSDDEWLPGKLEKQIKVFRNASLKVGVVYSGFWKIVSNAKTYIPSSKTIQKEGDIHWSLLEGNFITTPAAMVKRECLQRVGMFDERLPRLQDWDLWIRMSKYYHFGFIDEPLVISYYQTESISSDKSALVRADELILDKHMEEYNKRRRVLAKHYSRIGAFLCSNGELKQGRSYFKKALKAYPLDIQAFLLFNISFFGEGTYKIFLRIYQKTKHWWVRG